MGALRPGPGSSRINLTLTFTELTAAMSSASSVKTIPILFDKDDTEGSAKRIVYALYPDWKNDGTGLKFKTFTQGVTNTVSMQPDLSASILDLIVFVPYCSTARRRNIDQLNDRVTTRQECNELRGQY